MEGERAFICEGHPGGGSRLQEPESCPEKHRSTAGGRKQGKKETLELKKIIKRYMHISAESSQQLGLLRKGKAP